MTSAFTNNPFSLEAKAERFATYHGIGRRSGQSWIEAVEEDLEICRPTDRYHAYRCALWRRIVKRANAWAARRTDARQGTESRA